jgi:PhzF family phenazine biosynthesis protein
MRKYAVYQVDSFTKERFSGNPAGAVLNADGLSEAEMQNIARELNNSETAFFFKPENADYDGELRYFTPKTEVPTCGHATVAALYAKAVEEKLGECKLRIKTKVGILPMEIARIADDYRISMTQGAFEISPPLEGSLVDELLQGLRLTRPDLDGRCPIQIASTGHSKVLTGIKSRRTLNAIRPDNERLIALSAKIGCNGFFVFTFDTDKQGILTEGRMFAPAIGISEDPVTGNANGPLGAYLVRNQLVEAKGGMFRFVGYQGEAMKRPGKIEVEVAVEEGEPVRVTISGRAEIVFKTEMIL